MMTTGLTGLEEETKMNAKALIAYDKQKVALRDIEIGEPGEWDIAVEVETAGLSIGTESYHIGSVDPAEPRVIGYAPIARVTWVGKQAAALFAVGDRVTYFAPNPPLPAAGVIQLCGAYQSPAILTVNPSTRNLLAPNDFCVKIPADVAAEAAAFAGISAVSYFAAEMSNVKAGEKVLILGQGIIGLYATQHFALRGAEVCVADLYDMRLQMAARCGADHVINAQRDDVVTSVLACWPGGADIVVDATASYRVVEQSLPALRPGGRYGFLGYYKAGDFNLGLLQGRVYDAFFPWTLQGRLVVASLKLMEMGALRATELITHRFAVADAPQAYETAAKYPEATAGILLDWR